MSIPSTETPGAGWRATERSVPSSPERHDEIHEARDLRAGRPAGNAAGARRLEVVDDRDSPPHEQTLELARKGDRGRAAVARHETHTPHATASGLRGLHPGSVAGFRRNAARSSTFPSAPVIGEGIAPRLVRPSGSAAAVTRARARARTPSSRTMPPRPTSLTLRLELRLHEEEGVGSFRQERHGRRQDEGERDERHVRHEKRGSLGHVGARQEPRVHFLAHDDARVVPEAGMELTVADVEGVNPRRASREKHVRESARRGAEVETDPPLRLDPEMRQAEVQLHASARNPGMLGLPDFDLGVLRDRRSRFDPLAPNDRNPAREDERLGPRARFGEPALHEDDVQPLLQMVTTTFRTSPPWRASAKASAARASGTRCVTRSAARTTPRSSSASASRMSAAPQE